MVVRLRGGIRGCEGSLGEGGGKLGSGVRGSGGGRRMTDDGGGSQALRDMGDGSW